ncbi:MAG: glycosyltransferase [Candidatus Paceibacterota bacterium]|jgi:cellulose synthase/poly-beta-1,6-N-acetylglucosamine synthase-like glycosyltransferase|nr:glycosyltransferase [Candidatus Paceibacterota bacterium]
MEQIKISIIIPTYNERENADALLERLFSMILLDGGIVAHEFIVIDDHSPDRTYEYFDQKKEQYPFLRVYFKQGKKGKAQSILEGVALAKYDTVAMIDADLQYPPEAIPEMIRGLDNADIIVANRECNHERLVRRSLSRAYRSVVGKLLFGTNVDVQSGLKVFRKDVFYNLKLSPTEWGFDYEFLFKARRMRWKLGSVQIVFAERIAGESKVDIIRTGSELLSGALKLRFRYFFRSVFKFIDSPHYTEAKPLNYNNKVDFLFLQKIHSAKQHLFYETVSLLLFMMLLFAGFSYALSYVFGVGFLVFLSALISLFYLAFMVFKIRVIYLAMKDSPSICYDNNEIASLIDEDLPIYTIIIPLYKEAGVVDQIKKAMTSIDYPNDKLDVIITLEEYDHETISALKFANLPDNYKLLILPNVEPKTKPKALNVAFMYAQGEYLVIYDAEIIPDPDQLKKAVLAFREHPELGSLQTRLDHYNPRQSVISRFFNSEFAFHYDFFLPGLQKMNIPMPLSGHSTHFRTQAIYDIGAWDPYNVTEDCDLGIRLYRYGYRAGMLESGSREEAVTGIRNWVLQRTRWMKGFIQTSIVHLRHPIRFKNEIGGWGPFMGFLFIVPGGVLVNLLNFVSWFVLVTWILFQPNFVQTLYPLPILYLSTGCFIIGTFVFTFMNLLAAYHRERYDLVKFNLLSFAYWMLLSYATVRAAVEFVVRPYHWEKTEHGTHLVKKKPFAFPDFAEGFRRLAAKTTLF